MFIAILCIFLGAFLLLNTLGIIHAANFWGLFWAIVLLVLGIKMLVVRLKCPICAGYMWTGNLHKKMHGECDCGHDHEHHEGEDEEK